MLRTSQTLKRCQILQLRSQEVQEGPIGMNILFCTSKRHRFRLPEYSRKLSSLEVFLSAISAARQGFHLKQSAMASGRGFFGEFDFHSSQQSKLWL